MKIKQGLTFRISFGIIILVAIVGVIFSYVSTRILRSNYIELENTKLQEIVHIVASHADGDEIKKYYETGEKDAYYDELQSYMDNIAKSVGNMGFIYIMVPDKDHWTYIVEAAGSRYADVELDEFGDVYEYGESEYKYLLPDVEKQQASQGVIIGNTYEEMNVIPLSAWAPVFDSQGNMVAMVQGDVSLWDLYSNIKGFLRVISCIIILSLLLIIVSMIASMNAMVIRPLGMLTNYVASYEEGVFTGEEFKYHHNDEIAKLNESFLHMNGRIEEYIEKLTKVTAEKERIGAELDVASKIQSSMLPGIFPAFPDHKEFDVYALMDPAKEVGGDFYDFFLIDQDHLAMVIADVAGKGVPAALFMMVSMIHIKNQASNSYSPKVILEATNNLLCNNNEEDMFVTVWMGILDLKTGVITAANAGHEYPTIRRNDGSFELIKDKHGLALGIMEGIRYREYTIELEKGDQIFVYTDGVPEATSSEMELYGNDRMLEALNQNKYLEMDSVYAVIQQVRESIEEFVGEADQFDDITMLSVKYYGTEMD